MKDAVQQRHPRASRRIRLTLLRVCVSVFLIWFLLEKAGVGTLAATLRHASPGWLVLGLALGLCASATQISQWRGLLSGLGLVRSWRQCARMEYAGNVFDALLPTSVGGDVMRVFSAAGQRSNAAAAATSVLLRRVCNLPGLTLVMLVGLVSTSRLSYAGRIRPYVGVGAAIALAALVIVLTPLGWQVLRLPGLRSPKIAGRALHVREAFDRIRRNRMLLLRAVLRGLVFWILAVAAQFSYMKAIGIAVPLDYAAVVVTTVSALAFLPISLGGYGLREGAFSAFLTVGGLATAAQGVSVGLCVTTQTILMGLMGVPALILQRRRQHEVNAEEAAMRENESALAARDLVRLSDRGAP